MVKIAVYVPTYVLYANTELSVYIVLFVALRVKWFPFANDLIRFRQQLQLSHDRPQEVNQRVLGDV